MIYTDKPGFWKGWDSKSSEPKELINPNKILTVDGQLRQIDKDHQKNTPTTEDRSDSR